MCADASFSCFAFGPLDGLFFPAAVSKLHAYQASKAKGAKIVKHKNKDASENQNHIFSTYLVSMT